MILFFVVGIGGVLEVSWLFVFKFCFNEVEFVFFEIIDFGS